MQKRLKNRVIPAFLALVLLVSSVIIPVAAANDVFYDIDSASLWNSKFNATNVTLIDAISLGLSLGQLSSQDAAWVMVDKTIGGNYGKVSYDDLLLYCKQYNSIFNTYNGPISFFGEILGNHQALTNTVLSNLMGLGTLKFEVQKHPSSGLFRIKEITNNIWFVNSSGAYAYCEEVATDGGNKWIGESTAGDHSNFGTVNVQSLDVLNLWCVALKESGYTAQLKTVGKYKMIWAGRQILADSNGNPYGAQLSENEWAVNQPRPDTTVKDETGADVEEERPEGNTTNIDLSNMTITLPDGKVMIADQIIYDESTKTYHVDSHDTYNTTNNYYYEWNYYINYTSVTYIGQTAEYNKYYEVYYELPDGRDSADLTAEELEQLNLEIDVIPYGRSADDVSLRSLYHFDGDTKDSSYWNYCTDFTWNKGASLTYMESGSFDGCLYLDETEHDFTLTLPSDLGPSDFTFQFRYFQSHTAAPQTDSYIAFGATQLLKLDGANMKNGSGTNLSAMPVGSWNELALIRKSNTLYYYLNGVSVGNVSDSSVYPNQVTFHFGSGQQTYKQIDELRVVNEALVKAPANYSCTSVPYDTNLSLVLPDSQIPVADEYYAVTFDPASFVQEDFTKQTALSSHWSKANCSQTSYKDYSRFASAGTYSSAKLTNFNQMIRDNPSGTIVPADGGGGLRSAMVLKNGYNFICFSVMDAQDQMSSLSAVVYYRDGDSTVSAAKDHVLQNTLKATRFIPGGALAIVGNSAYLLIKPKSSGGSLNIRAMEIHIETFSSLADAKARMNSFSSVFASELITSIIPMDPAQMKTPTLAVRTDLDITSYQIGGPRPSLPTKGLVWALVEGQFITSIQIYNGQAWEACDGRIWTGERWIPYRSYNVITLKDMYDVVDGSGSDYEYIYTQQGFWSWWQKSWNAFTERLFSGLGIGPPGSGSGGGSGGSKSFWERIKDAFTDTLASVIEGLFDFIKTVLQGILGLAKDLLSFFFNFLTDTVIGGISDFFAAFQDGSLTSFFQQSTTDEEGNIITSTGLPSEIGTAFAFISGLIMLLPADLRSVLFFGIGAMLFFAIFKLVKG